MEMTALPLAIGLSTLSRVKLNAKKEQLPYYFKQLKIYSKNKRIQSFEQRTKLERKNK